MTKLIVWQQVGRSCSCRVWRWAGRPGCGRSPATSTCRSGTQTPEEPETRSFFSNYSLILHWISNPSNSDLKIYIYSLSNKITFELSLSWKSPWQIWEESNNSHRWNLLDGRYARGKASRAAGNIISLCFFPPPDVSAYLVCWDFRAEYFREIFLERGVDGSHGVDLTDWQMGGGLLRDEHVHSVVRLLSDQDHRPDQLTMMLMMMILKMAMMTLMTMMVSLATVTFMAVMAFIVMMKLMAMMTFMIFMMLTLGADFCEA